MADLKNDFPTTLGPDAIFKGHLQFEKGVRLLGQFDGEIVSEGQLLIAEGAMLTGDVKAGSVCVEGRVKGNLSAKTKVQLTSSARLEGDVQAARLEVAEGAVLVGRCMVGVNGQGKGRPDSKPVSVHAATVAPAKPKPMQPIAGGPATIKS